MADRQVSRSAVPISSGVGLIGVALMFAWIWPDGAGRDAALAPFALGLCFVVWGLYQLIDNLDRAARKIIERE